MPTEYSWPRLRAILDTALESEKGIMIPYETWSVAERVRANMYKIRDMQRRESRKVYPDPMHPSHGVSAYDGLILWLRSSISRTDQKIIFAGGDFKGTEAIALSEVTKKSEENENLFKGERMTVSITTSAGVATVENAPSYKVAWDLLRRDFQTFLILENGYTLDHLDIKEL